MNKVFLIGNLTRDPELRTTQSGISVCSFTIAVNRRRGSRGSVISGRFACFAPGRQEFHVVGLHFQAGPGGAVVSRIGAG